MLPWSAMGYYNRTMISTAALLYVITYQRIDGDYNVKVADFGLTKDVYDRNYYRAIKNEKVPARWMPLESLVNGVWSEKSDVVSINME